MVGLFIWVKLYQYSVLQVTCELGKQDKWREIHCTYKQTGVRGARNTHSLCVMHSYSHLHTHMHMHRTTIIPFVFVYGKKEGSFMHFVPLVGYIHS